jgi:oleandomycin transport system ATP-binding protein
LLARFDLTEAAARPAKTYSGGMRRRLDLAASLVGSPQVLYLDEPTTGLDPRSRTDVWGMIRGLVADGVTVLLTTQYLDEADHLAHDIVVIDRGTVVATGTPDELKAKTGGQVLRVAPADPARMAEVTALMAAMAGAEVNADAGDRVATTPVSDPGLVPRVFRELDDRGIELAEFTLRRASLDEVFFALTGHRADDGQDGKQDSDRELEDTRR